jgi:hypothetical protein
MNPQMVYCVATRGWQDWKGCMMSWFRTASTKYPATVCKDMDVVPALQRLYEDTKEPILAYLHDDVIIHEKNWDVRVLKEFEDESIGLVSFTGALGHGRPDLYRVPYHLPDLARQVFISNMRDAETHGARFTGERDVAIADGSTCFVRRSILDKLDGWTKAAPYGYWLYMEWICCEVRRAGYRIRTVGVEFEHLGGKTSGHIATVPSYEDAHRFLYDNNRDVLPFRVKE